MTWVRLDDSMPEHPKMVGLTDRAFRVHVCGLCYSNRNLTDGFIPRQIALKLVANSTRSCAELVAAGVWDLAANGYQIHDYAEYQPSREKVLQERKKTADRVSRWRDRNAVTNAVTPPQRNAVSNGAPIPDPDPSLLSLVSPSLQGRSANPNLTVNDKTINPGTAASIERLLERLADADHGTIGRLVKLAKAGACQADFEDARAAITELAPTSPSRYACHIITTRMEGRP